MRKRTNVFFMAGLACTLFSDGSDAQIFDYQERYERRPAYDMRLLCVPDHMPTGGPAGGKGRSFTVLHVSPRLILPGGRKDKDGDNEVTWHPSDPGKIEGAVNPFLIEGSRIVGLEDDDGGVLKRLEFPRLEGNRPKLHSQGVTMYGERRTLPGFNAALSVLCRFATTGRADTGVIVECDPGGVWGRACAELGLNFAGGQGSPAPKVHDPRAYMLYASTVQHRPTLRTPLQASDTSGMDFSLFMAPSSIDEVGLFLDDERVPSQTKLIQTVMLALEFGTEVGSLRKEDYTPRRQIMQRDERGVFLLDWGDLVANEHLVAAADCIAGARCVMLINRRSKGNSSLVISECTQPPCDVEGRTW